MKRIIFAIAFTAFSSMGLFAQKVKSLPQPDMNINVSIMEAMKNRRSYRDYQPDKQIS